MSDYPQLKLSLEHWLDQLHKSVDQLASSQFFDPEQISRWREHLKYAHGSLQDVPLRIAVVGTVKSGKSTLINSLVARDLLKRGAGITTAFITRIISNDRCGGWLEFKAWPQVNREISELLHLLAVESAGGAGQSFLDLREEGDRQHLNQIRDTLRTQHAVSGASTNPYLLLLNAYLQGYPSMQSRLAETVTRIELADHDLQQHQDYVGREAHAVYLQDIEIHLPVAWLGNHLEITDCQGSDSPNPAHFAALQDHLLQSHLIVYLISGRTGLREADYRLLNFIKSLRMLPSTLLVLNIDLDWHPTSDDFNQFCKRVSSELDWFTISPQLFAFSALYQLIDALGDQAAASEQRRMEAWREGIPWLENTEASYSSFRKALNSHVDRRRRQVLLNHAANRTVMLANHLDDSVTTLASFLSEDRQAVARATQKLKERKETFRAACLTLQQAIQRAEEDLRGELALTVDKAFDLTNGPLVIDTLALVDQFTVPPDLLQSMTSPLEVIQQVHTFYLQFRQRLWTTLVEKVNVKMIEFAKDRQEWLMKRLLQAAEAFWSLFVTALDNYRQELASLHIPVQPSQPLGDAPWPELEHNPPPQFSAYVNQVPLSRSILLIKYGLGRLSGYLTDLKFHLGRQLAQVDTAAQPSSLEEAIALVRAETRTELLLAFRNYRQLFKNSYMLPLLKTSCSNLLREFETRAELAQVSFTQAFERGMEHQECQHQAVAVLNSIGQNISGVKLEIRDFWSVESRSEEQ